MIERWRLFVIVAATALAAAPLAAQTSPTNPFGLSQGQRTDVGRPHPRHAWRMERRGERMRCRRERMERRARWLRAHGDAFRERAYGGRASGGRAFAHREFAYRGHRWEHREFGERRAFPHGGAWRQHARALRGGRWGGGRAWTEGRLRSDRQHGRWNRERRGSRLLPHESSGRRPRREERSRTDGTL